MKSFTSLEQSKKLAEILPLESADMHYVLIDTESELYSAGLGEYIGILPHYPCWSLAALLGILPTIDDRNAEFCKDIRYDKWHVFYHSTATLPLIDTERYHDIVDACYEMILNLHELKML